MSLVWLVYTVATGAGRWFSSSLRHRLALLSVSISSCWFLFSLFANILAENDIQVSVSYSGTTLADFKNLSGILYAINNFIHINLPYLSLAYLVMLILLSIRYINYFRHSLGLKLSGLSKIDPEFRLFTASVARHLGIRKKVQVWLSAVVESPMVVGFIKPIILIPIATVNHLTTQQVESILLHELSHIKRDDYLVNLIVTINGIILFFNPFAHLLINNINIEREHSCDDMVLQFRYDPCLYASALLSLEKTRNQSYQMGISAIGKSNQLLLERVRRVIGHNNFYCNYHSRLIGNLILTLSTGLILLLQPYEIKSGSAESVKTKINPVAETRLKDYVSTAFPAKVKTKKQTKSRNNEAFARPAANEVQWVSNDESEDQNDQANILPAVQEESQEYSIAPSIHVSTLTPCDQCNNYPFVPNSSFCFKVTEDTASSRNPERNFYTVRLANGLIEKALKACNEADWKKINIQKLELEIRKFITEDNGDKISGDNCISLSEADGVRIFENIHLELKSLQNNGIKYKLQRQYLKSQEGGSKKADQSKKRNKIVYI
jgi:beta-lactamase regulating signal transducer with metallopeptidase domain